MKRITSIAAVLMLSLLIVWMSAGVALWHCAHTGMTMRLSVQQQPMASGCCAQESQAEAKPCCANHHAQSTHLDVPPCMSLKVLQLSPTTTAPTAKYVFAHAQSVVLFCLLVAPLVVPIMQRRSPHRAPAPWHSPPRRYLCKLRMLLI